MMTFLRILGIGVAALAALAFGIAMWEAALARADGEPNDVRANELHHAYLGLLLIVATVPLGSWRWIATLWVGALVMAEDACEHLRTVVEPTFESPLHQVYGFFYARFAIVRIVQAWLDRRFGKRA